MAEPFEPAKILGGLDHSFSAKDTQPRELNAHGVFLCLYPAKPRIYWLRGCFIVPHDVAL